LISAKHGRNALALRDRHVPHAVSAELHVHVGGVAEDAGNVQKQVLSGHRPALKAAVKVILRSVGLTYTTFRLCTTRTSSPPARSRGRRVHRAAAQVCESPAAMSLPGAAYPTLDEQLMDHGMAAHVVKIF
jgi:hypothetical protein